MGIEKTIEIKAIDKEKALKRALNILGVELTENEAVEIVEKVKPRKKFFGLFGTEPGIYEVSIKTKEKEQKEKKISTQKSEKVEKTEKVETSHKNNIENIELEKEITEKVSFLQQKLMGTSDNPQMKNMMFVFPILMIYISYRMPSGLQLYWLTSSILAVVQQYFIMKKGA